MDNVKFCITLCPALQDISVPIDTLNISVHGDQNEVVSMLITAMEQKPKIASLLSSSLIMYFRSIGKLDEFLQMARLSGALMDGDMDGPG